MANAQFILFDQQSGRKYPIRLVDNLDGTYSIDVNATLGAGDAITGESLEAGGSGILGWLSSLRKKIADRLPAALGQGTMAQSMPVVIANNQSTVPVSLATVPALVTGTATIGATKDAGPNWTSVFGVSGAAVVSVDMTTAAAVTDAPTAGQKIVVTDVLISADTAMSVLLEEETSGTDIAKVFIPANGTVQITMRGKTKLATADKKLTAKASGAGNIAVTTWYYSEA